MYDDAYMVIPKLLHRIWLGDQPMDLEDQRWWERWRELHPSWELRTWGEQDLVKLGCGPAWELSCNPGYRSDVGRLHLLSRIGGVYVDTDVEPLQSLEPLLQHVTSFAGSLAQSSEHPLELGVQNAVLGCRPGDEWFGELVETLPSWAEVLARSSAVVKSGPLFLSSMLRARRARGLDVGLTLYGQEVFYAGGVRCQNRLQHVTPASVALHHWRMRWLPRPG